MQPRAYVAEFHKNASGRLILFSLVVIKEGTDQTGREWQMRATYDVDHSRQYGYIFHMSGAGGSHHVPVSGPYFASGDIEVEEQPSTLINRKARKRNRTRKLRSVPKAFALEPGRDLLHWLEQNAIEETAVYCSVCRDHMPSDQLCDHCWWCDEIGWYSTPSERCKCGRKECGQ